MSSKSNRAKLIEFMAVMIGMRADRICSHEDAFGFKAADLFKMWPGIDMFYCAKCKKWVFRRMYPVNKNH